MHDGVIDFDSGRSRPVGADEDYEPNSIQATTCIPTTQATQAMGESIDLSLFKPSGS